MTSRVEVPPLTGLIHFFLSSLKVKNVASCSLIGNQGKEITVEELKLVAPCHCNGA